jgi:PilZ domain
MDRRRKPRVTALLPARVWGVDAFCQPFMQVVTVKNISDGGAVIQGMQRRVRPGEVLELQVGEEKAPFRVVWVGRPGGRGEGEIGLQGLPTQSNIREMELYSCACAAGQG